MVTYIMSWALVVVILGSSSFIYVSAYETLRCMHTYRATTKRQKLPIALSAENSLAVWCVKATGKRHEIWWSVKSSDLKPTASCNASDDSLKIVDGCNLTAAVTVDVCGHTESQFNSKSPCIAVVLHGNPQPRHVDLSLEYFTKAKAVDEHVTNMELYRKRLTEPYTHVHVTTEDSKQVCGNKDIIKQTRGYVTSPGYPKNYTHNLSCNYKIELEVNTKIQLIFRDVKLQKRDKYGNCLDYVEVYDGHASWATKLKTAVCGDGEEVVNEPILSTSNKLRIKFVTDDKYSDKGFYLTYDPNGPKKVTDMTQKVTGVVIGTACGLVFLILSFLAVCHSRRLHLLRRRDTTRYEIASTSGPDVVEEGAPPSYDDVMSSPEKYPPTPNSPKEASQFLDAENLDSEDEPPPYPGLVVASESGNDRRDNPSYVIRLQAISQAISTDV